MYRLGTIDWVLIGGKRSISSSTGSGGWVVGSMIVGKASNLFLFFWERLETGVEEGDIAVVEMVGLEVIEPRQDMTFANAKIGLKLALISI